MGQKSTFYDALCSISLFQLLSKNEASAAHSLEQSVVGSSLDDNVVEIIAFILRSKEI